ncbi:MAG TPA: hypothetical protein VK079_02260, partial [Bacillota bacterium]|nr:hypothetical protein [Bacillota bacterium]
MMKRFCIECGKEATPEHNICIHCGTPLPKIEAFDRQADKREQAEEPTDHRTESAENKDPNDEPLTSKSFDKKTDETGQEVDKTLPTIAPSGTPDGADIEKFEQTDVAHAASQEIESERKSGQTGSETDHIESSTLHATALEQGHLGPSPEAESTQGDRSEAGATSGSNSTEENQLSDSEHAHGDHPAPEREAAHAEVATTQAETSATSSTETMRGDAAPASRKAKSGKKRKLLWRFIAFFAILLIAFVVWANHYTSPEAVEKRFQKAVDSNDVSQIQKLLVHGDLTSIETFEAEAFLELVKTEGRSILSSLTDTVYSGKFLFIFDAHKIEVTDQIPYSDQSENMTYTFNGEEVAIFDEEDDNIAYGPLAPGVYEVAANLSNDFGDFSAEETILLASTSYQEYTYMDIDMPVAEVFFYVENANSIDPKHIKVKVNDKEFPIDEHQTTESIGPMPIDGSVDASVVFSLPWGEIESEAQPV